MPRKRKPAPEAPPKAEDSTPQDSGDGVQLCDCGSGKPVLSPGYCRSCAAKKGGAARQARLRKLRDEMKSSLCDCGSGKPVCSTGRCRSCASKLANQVRKANLQQQLLDWKAEGVTTTGAVALPYDKARQPARSLILDDGLDLTNVHTMPACILGHLSDQGDAAGDALLQLHRVLDGGDVPPRFADWVTRAARLLNSFDLFGMYAELKLRDEGIGHEGSNAAAGELKLLKLELDGLRWWFREPQP